jgi:hypothetical protein
MGKRFELPLGDTGHEASTFFFNLCRMPMHMHNILEGASVTLHIILLGVGGTIYNTHTLKPFKELGLDSQRVKKLASKLYVHSVNFAAKLVHTRRALSSTVINSSGAGFRPSLQPSILIPIYFSFPYRGRGALRYSIPKWLLFLN